MTRGHSTRRLLLLLACLLLALAVGVYALSQSRMVRARALVWTESVLRDAFGREVRVEAVRLQPWIGSLELAGLRVARVQALADGVLFSAETIQARWSWSALLRRQLVLRQIVLARPEVTLSGQGAPIVAAPDLLPLLLQSRVWAGKGWELRIRRATVRNGRLTWTDSDGTQPLLEGLEGDVRWDSASGGAAVATANLRAARLSLTRGETTRQLDRLSLQVKGTAEALSVSAAEFSIAGGTVTVHGDIADPGRTPRLDLSVGVQAPLRDLLVALGVDRQIEGTVAVRGRLRGAWEQPVFHGEGVLRFVKDLGKSQPVQFSIHWEDGGLVAETLGGPARASGSFYGRLALEPATGLFRLWADLKDTDMAALPGLPGAVAAQVGASLPPDVQGRVTGVVDLTGRGGDVSALRGQLSLVARDLALRGETPSGRLEARLTATASRIDIEAFSLQLPGGDLIGRGELALATKKLNVPVSAEIRDVTAFAQGFGFRLLGGRATLQGRLTGTQQAPSLQGHISWHEARIAGRALDLIEGDVEVSHRVLRMSRLVVRNGQSTATLQGSLEASGTTPLRRLDPTRDLVLDVQLQVNPGRTADLLGFLPNDVEVQGAFRATGQIRGTLQALTGEIGVGLVNFRTWEETWQRGEAVFRLRPGGLEITRIVLRRGAEQLIGEIGIGAGGALRGRLTSTVMNVARVGSLSGSQLAGRATFRLDFQGTLRDTVTLGQATVTALFFRGIPVGPGTAVFTVEHKAVDVDLTIRQGTHRLHVRVGPPGDRSVSGELVLSDADLDLAARLAEMQATWSNRAHGSGRIRFSGQAHDPVFGSGEAEFTDLRLQVMGEAWENQGNVQVSWSGSTMRVGQLRLRSGNHECEVGGTVTAGGQSDLTVMGDIPLTLLTGYLPAVRPTKGVANANLHVWGDPGAHIVEGTLQIQQGQVTVSGLPADFQEVQARLDLPGNRAEIREWRARLAEGNFLATGAIGLNGERWDLRLGFQEEKGRAEQLLLGLYGGKGEVTGQLSLEGLLTSEGEERADFWRNLGGNLKLTLRDGRIGHYTVTAKILALLNMAHLVSPRGPDLAAEGMPYQRLGADIKIANGIARTDDLVLDSRAMKLSAVGAVDLTQDTVDMTVAVRPFQNVDRIVTAIPLAGWILGGKEKSILVAYYRVTGSLRNPQVTAVPLQSVGRNIFGIFRNLLEIPETLTGPYDELPPQPVKPEEGGESR